MGVVATYAKKERGLEPKFVDTLVSRQKVSKMQQESMRITQLDADIRVQELVVQLCEKGIWPKIRKFGDRREILTARDHEMISRALRFPDQKPSVRDSTYLLKLVKRLSELGFSSN